jgi:hypothetical protein
MSPDWTRQSLAEDTVCGEPVSAAGVSPRYVRELYNLVYLSPRLVEMILAGRQPPDLTLDQLVVQLPYSWRAQDRKLGFESAS